MSFHGLWKYLSRGLYELARTSQAKPNLAMSLISGHTLDNLHFKNFIIPWQGWESPEHPQMKISTDLYGSIYLNELQFAFEIGWI